jgi:hypothetical protein
MIRKIRRISMSLLSSIISFPQRVFSGKGRGPTALGVVRPKTANAIGLLPVKSFLLDFPRDLQSAGR